MSPPILNKNAAPTVVTGVSVCRWVCDNLAEKWERESSQKSNSKKVRDLPSGDARPNEAKRAARETQLSIYRKIGS